MDLEIDYLVGKMLLNHAMKDLDATDIYTTAVGIKRRALETWHAPLDQHGFKPLHSGTSAGRPVAASPVPPANATASGASLYPPQRRRLSGESGANQPAAP
jgi:hypothetical protein